MKKMHVKKDSTKVTKSVVATPTVKKKPNLAQKRRIYQSRTK